MKYIASLILLALSFAASASDLIINRIYTFAVLDAAANYTQPTINDVHTITLTAPSKLRAIAVNAPSYGQDGPYDGNLEAVEVFNTATGANIYTLFSTTLEGVNLLTPSVLPAGTYSVRTQFYCSGINPITGACGSRYTLQLRNK